MEIDDMQDDGGWETADAAPDGGAPPQAMFVLGDVPGLSVDVDEDDNPNNHAVLTSDAGIQVSFTVFNVGSASGACTVDLAIDGSVVTTWNSSDIAPNGAESAVVK